MWCTWARSSTPHLCLTPYNFQGGPNVLLCTARISNGIFLYLRQAIGIFQHKSIKWSQSRTNFWGGLSEGGIVLVVIGSLGFFDTNVQRLVLQTLMALLIERLLDAKALSLGHEDCYMVCTVASVCINCYSMGVANFQVVDIGWLCANKSWRLLEKDNVQVVLVFCQTRFISVDTDGFKQIHSSCDKSSECYEVITFCNRFSVIGR